MKVLLIYPPFPMGEGMGSIMCSPPLNMLTLAGAVPEHEVDILDLNVDRSYGIKKFEEILPKYDLVGITCMSATLRMTLTICKLAKKCGVPTLVGGFHPSLDPSIIEQFDVIDMLVRGEGELTFKELLSGKPKNEILGLSYKENGKVFHNPDRPFIKNLDELPFPRNDLVDPKPYHYFWVRSWVCETSRGCPFNCGFCCVHVFYKRTYRTKTPERVIRELYQIPPKVKLVFFADDNFTMNKKRVMRICKLIQKSRLNKRLYFVCQARVDDMANNPEMVAEMRKSGFILVFLGVESLKQMALDYMEKGYTLDKLITCIENCHRNGILVLGSFIIGNIGETVEDTRKTFKLMKALDIDFIMTMPITPFPRTKLSEEASEKGWTEKEIKWEKRKSGETRPIMRTPDLTREDIQRLLSESYRSFYQDRDYQFTKYLTSRGTFRKSKDFNWVWSFFFGFIKNAPKFLNRFNKIVDEVYEEIS